MPKQLTKPIEHLASQGINITYDRIIESESEINLEICKLLGEDNLVWLPNLKRKKNHRGPMENLDHNPS